ncbi:alpha/beta hydrolase family protein [Steroidobacter sp.]|uniref:S9 family peptidase n=1 Tax=Steroidobacter sp. TaxID=1978227 RepID=UPI001A38292E|nr:S9 family peptidase [Steroidobacter sp.]MBL8268723.1 S9 family peptidase [Steroidobacter sp.]
MSKIQPAHSGSNVRKRLAAACVAVGLSLLAGTSSAAESNRITFADLDAEVGFSGQPAISPDGRSIALLVTRADWVDNRFNRQLVIVDTETGAQRIVAPGRNSISAAKWSPDGTQLAWLDSPSGTAAQIFIARSNDFDGARAVTKAAAGVGAFKWSPDGASIAYTTADSAPPPASDDPHNRSFEVDDRNNFLSKERLMPTQLWVISVAGGAAQRLTSGQESVEDFEWASSQSLAFTAKAAKTTPTPSIQELTAPTELYSVDSGGGARKSVLAANPNAPIGSMLATSPNQQWLAFMRSRGPEFRFRAEGITLVSTSSGEVRNVTSAIDRNFRDGVWLPDSKSLISVAVEGSKDAMWLVPLDGAARKVDVGPVTDVRSVSTSASGAIAFLGMEARRNTELYFKRSAEAKPKRLTAFNEPLANKQYGPLQTIHWQLDGFDQVGVLIHPPGFQKGKRYPLVVAIHGGPMTTSTETFTPYYELLAAQGWLVFTPNYRGSTSAGDAYRRAIVNDAGDGPGRDVMAGIATVKALGIVDEQRIALSGWSYGGYLTAWLTSHYQGWSAAVAGAAVTDFADEYSLSDFNAWYGYSINGSPYIGDNDQQYREQSPIHFARNIRTPTLILALTGDRRVPITQSYKLYRALRDNGTAVQFIAYPLDGHTASDPVHTRDVRRRWLQWIADHFNAAAPSERRDSAHSRPALSMIEP